MRRTLIIMAALMVVLQACVPGVLTGDPANGNAPAISGDEIAVTTLADPLKPAMVDAAEPLEAGAQSVEAIAEAAEPATRPKARPDDVAETAAEIPVPESVAPEEPKSREQIRCEKSGGRWSVVGEGKGRSCVKTTRDGGKSCSRQGQCEGQCLARSRTCAPFDPLWGCNDVLQDDGSRVTLCLN